jgi:transcription elongation factor SPT6
MSPKSKFIAQSASESDEELNDKKTANNNNNSIIDSSSEGEEEEEAMTKEDLEFVKDDEENSLGEKSSKSDSDASSSSSEVNSPDELSEDDLELIEENLGKRRSNLKGSKGTFTSTGSANFKRLRRRNEIDSEDEKEEENDTEDAGDISTTRTFNENNKSKSHQLQNLFDEEASTSEDEDDDLNDFIEDEESSSDELPETIDAAMKAKKKSPSAGGIPRRRAIVDDLDAPTRALSSALASGQISKEAWNEMIEIFGDGTDYLDMVVESGDEEDYENDEHNEHNEHVSGIAALKIDKTYKDFPERYIEMGIEIINNNNNDDDDDKDEESRHSITTSDAFLQNEAVFIAAKLQKLQVTDSISGLTSAVHSVLRFIHQHGLEIPFIATYRKEYFLLFFGMNELWTILDEDVKYRAILGVKERITGKLGEISHQLEPTDRTYLEQFLQDQWDEAQLQFIQEFLIQERRRILSLGNSGKKVSSSSLLLRDFAHKIIPSAAKYSENITKGRVLHGPLVLSEREMESEAVDLVAKDVAGSVEAVISGGISLLAEEFGMHPRLFGHVQDLLLNRAKLTVTPTALGSIEISHDPTHFLTSLQYVTSKPISAFVEDQGLVLARGVEGKLISISISFDESEPLTKLRELLPGLEEFKGRVFELAWSSFWRPRLNGLVLQRLRSEAENWTAHFMQFYLQDELMTAPLSLASRVSVDDGDLVVTSISVFKEQAYLVELDKHGRVLRQETKPLRPIRALSISRTCEFVVVSGEGQDCVDLYRELRETVGRGCSVVWGCEDTARCYCGSVRASREFPECPSELKFAVGVGRRMLNPVGEFAMLGEEDLLQVPLHSLQASLPRPLRLKHLRRALVNVINLLGVSVNELLLSGQKESLLSYVSGLGPKIAADLSQRCGKFLASRSDLVVECGLGPRTFTNCAGFIKIVPERKKRALLAEPLDGTRIHPESYELARKMAADALELDDPTTLQRRQDIFGDDDSEAEDAEISRAIVQVMREPRKLDDLLLEEYAKEIERLKHLPKHMTLFDIKAELQGPFPDPRVQQLQGGAVPSAPVHQIVRMLTGRDESWWHVGRSVMIKPLRNNPTSVSLLDANNLTAKISDPDPPRSLHPLRAFISHLNLPRLQIDVTLKRPSDNDKIALQGVRFDPFYDFKRAMSGGGASTSNVMSSNVMSSNTTLNATLNTTTSNNISNTNTNTNNYFTRHAAFKNLTRSAAQDFLASAPVGDFLLRPSSHSRPPTDQLPGDLSITWKLAPGLFVHYPLGELEKPKNIHSLGRILLLPALITQNTTANTTDRFEDLDEIVARRIEPVLSLIQEAQACPKFFAHPENEAINAHLRSQASSTPGRIPYCITLAMEPNCGHLVLSHPTRKEIIRVDPRGYALTDPKSGETRIFERIDKLVDYFKRNYKNFTNPKDQHQQKPQSTPVQTETDDPRQNKYQQFAN